MSLEARLETLTLHDLKLSYEEWTLVFAALYQKRREIDGALDLALKIDDALVEAEERWERELEWAKSTLEHHSGCCCNC